MDTDAGRKVSDKEREERESGKSGMACSPDEGEEDLAECLTENCVSMDSAVNSNSEARGAGWISVVRSSRSAQVYIVNISSTVVMALPYG